MREKNKEEKLQSLHSAQYFNEKITTIIGMETAKLL